MEQITIKDYAESRKVSYETVSRQIRHYKKDLKGHINYQGRLILLDESAVAFLDQHRMKRNIVLAPTPQEIQNDFKRLQAELQEVMADRDRLKDQIIALQNEKTQLIEYKVKNEHLQAIADKSQSELQEVRESNKNLTENYYHAKLELETQRTANRVLNDEKAQIQEQMEQATEELNRYKPTLFGLYRKI